MSSFFLATFCFILGVFAEGNAYAKPYVFLDKPGQAEAVFKKMNGSDEVLEFVSEEEIQEFAEQEIRNYDADQAKARSFPVAQAIKTEPGIRCFKTTYLITGSRTAIDQFTSGRVLAKSKTILEEGFLSKTFAEFHTGHSCTVF